MTSSLVITDPAELDGITNEIHDCWFNVDDIVFNKETAVLEIRVAKEAYGQREVARTKLFLKRLQIPLMEYLLEIHYVEAYHIEDTQKIGSYDFNKLEYDPFKREVSVLTGVPIKIKAKVKKLEVSLVGTRKQIGEKTRLSLFR